MSLYCPLCNSGNVHSAEKIRVSNLAGLYEKMLGESILQEFSGCRELDFFSCKECDLKFFYPPLTGSEKFYEKLQKFDWYYMEDKNEYDFAKEYISESDFVLEVGCGKGAFAKKIKSKEYTGLEFSSRAKLIGEKEGVSIVNESVQIHAQNNRQKYDVVCSFQVLEHVSDVNGFLNSSIECLKPGGLLIVSVPSADTFLSSVTNGILNMPPHHVTWWSDKSLESIADIFGIEMIDLEHEMLADIHKDWFSATLTLNVLNAFLKRRTRLIDTSLTGRIVNMIAIKMGRFYGLALGNKNMRPYGHSVTVIYRKPTVL